MLWLLLIEVAMSLASTTAPVLDTPASIEMPVEVNCAN
jgi:hypothetical protein